MEREVTAQLYCLGGTQEIPIERVQSLKEAGLERAMTFVEADGQERKVGLGGLDSYLFPDSSEETTAKVVPFPNTRVLYREVPLKVEEIEIDSAETGRRVNFVYLLGEGLGYSRREVEEVVRATTKIGGGSYKCKEAGVLLTYEILKGREVLERPLNGLEGLKWEVAEVLETAGVRGEMWDYIREAQVLLVAEKMERSSARRLKEGEGYKQAIYGALRELEEEAPGRNPVSYTQALRKGVEKLIGKE